MYRRPLSDTLPTGDLDEEGFAATHLLAGPGLQSRRSAVEGDVPEDDLGRARGQRRTQGPALDAKLDDPPSIAHRYRDRDVVDPVSGDVEHPVVGRRRPIPFAPRLPPVLPCEQGRVLARVADADRDRV